MSVSRRTIEERKAFTERIKGVCIPDPGSPDAYDEDGDVRLLDGPQLISSYWNACPAQGLQVIVQQLCTFTSRSMISMSNNIQRREDQTSKESEKRKLSLIPTMNRVRGTLAPQETRSV
jgi:hypothetical protein